MLIVEYLHYRNGLQKRGLILVPVSKRNEDNRHSGRHWLMSPVLNHPTALWFYAYFICISLNVWGTGNKKRLILGEKNPDSLSDDYLESCMHDLGNLPIRLFSF
uniref:Uncharacterized protein n=1 Tax=Oryzias sinensis TaxID=183150 RepID=A0A8C7X3K4_9TELE